MPSGSNSRFWRKSGKHCPDTTSTIRPSEMMPDWQYSHLLPGSKCSGLPA